MAFVSEMKNVEKKLLKCFVKVQTELTDKMGPLDLLKSITIFVNLPGKLLGQMAMMQLTK